MDQEVAIRKETPADYDLVVELTEKAFETMEFSDGTEGRLVDKLRRARTFVSELSLVAELNGQVVGHILFTPIRIENDREQFDSLALAPVSILPGFQNQGIGSQLILAGHQKARELGFKSVIVLGHPEYYPRFGYRPASFWQIEAPFELPSDEVFMALELTEGALTGVSGMVRYPPEFE